MSCRVLPGLKVMEERLETKVEALEGTQKKLTVTIDAKEVNDRFKKTYRSLARQYNFPGFRRGRAPRPVIDSMLTPERAIYEVTDYFTNTDIPLAINQENIVAIGQAKVDDDQKPVEEGKPYTFSFTIDVRPEFELDNYDDVSIKVPSKEVTDGEIDEQVEQMRTYYYDFKDAAASKKLDKDGYAEITVTTTDKDGNKVDILSSESRLYQLGTTLFPKGFDDELEGAKKGDEKKFSLEVKKGPDSGLLAGNLDDGTYDFDVKIDQVKEKVLPEVNDKWAKDTAGFKDLADMREQIKKQLAQQKEQDRPRVEENEILYALADRLQGEAPQAMCDGEETNLLQSFFQQLQQGGVTFDAYLQQAGMSSKEFQEDVKKQAKDVSNQDLALDAWARHANITVSKDDIIKELKDAGVKDAEKTYKDWESQGRIPDAKAGLARSKAIDDIKANHLKETELKPGEKLPDHDAPKDDSKDEKKSTAKKTSSTKKTTKSATTKKTATKAATVKKSTTKTASKTTKKSE